MGCTFEYYSALKFRKGLARGQNLKFVLSEIYKSYKDKDRFTDRGGLWGKTRKSAFNECRGPCGQDEEIAAQECESI